MNHFGDGDVFDCVDLTWNYPNSNFYFEFKHENFNFIFNRVPHKLNPQLRNYQFSIQQDTILMAPMIRMRLR